MENKIYELDVSKLSSEERKLYDAEFNKQVNLISINKKQDRKNKLIVTAVIFGAVLIISGIIAIVIATLH